MRIASPIAQRAVSAPVFLVWHLLQDANACATMQVLLVLCFGALRVGSTSPSNDGPSFFFIGSISERDDLRKKRTSFYQQTSILPVSNNLYSGTTR
jgi:hypothetical protein